jgi:hypothetical protein
VTLLFKSMIKTSTVYTKSKNQKSLYEKIFNVLVIGIRGKIVRDDTCIHRLLIHRSTLLLCDQKKVSHPFWLMSIYVFLIYVDDTLGNGMLIYLVIWKLICQSARSGKG